MKNLSAPSRRRFLESTAALGIGAELAPWNVLASVTPRPEETRVGPDMVRFRPEIEPIVRLIEETPREQVLAMAIAQLRDGLSYRDFLAGLFLAGIRNIKPRPVGFKFHAVMVINSAHLLGQAAAAPDRLLPLFWALDNFKSSQAQDVREGDWVLPPPANRLPGPSKASVDFLRAMDAWDEQAADAAITALARSAGAAGAMEPVWRMAVRDQRDIGHKAIFAAQSWRTLQTIGWQHAEPVLRSVAFALLDLQGDSRRVAVGPYEANLKTASTIRDDWSTGRDDPGATHMLLEALRSATPEAASNEAAKILNSGVSPGSVWDAVLLSAAELLYNAPGIIPIHATTASNALHYIFNASGDDLTRRLALLQAVGWQPMYRDRMKLKNPIAIDSLKTDEKHAQTSEESVAALFDAAAADKQKGGARAAQFLSGGGQLAPIFDAARRLIFQKGRDSHDYKYGAAICEEVIAAAHTSSQAPLVAAAMAQFPSAKAPDSPLILKARDALATLAKT